MPTLQRARSGCAVVLLLWAPPACALRAHATLVGGTPVPQTTELWAEAAAGLNMADES